MSRGDIVVVSAPGHFGKPRPALVVRTNLLNATHASIAVCLMSSDLAVAPLFRIPVEPNSQNGLKVRSEVMVDKIIAVSRGRIGKSIGSLDEDTLLQVNRSLALVLGLAE